MISRALRGVYHAVLGKHPTNTIASFNYGNVRHIDRFVRRAVADLPAELAVLDVGAGSSPYFPLVRDRVASYVAVDVAEERPAGLDGSITYRCGTAEALPVLEASVDVVLCNQVLEHVRSAEQAAAEIARVLRPGGVLIGSVPHVSPIHLEPHDYRRLTAFGIRSLLEDAGLVDVEVEGSGGPFQSATLLITMGWVLSRMREGQPQRFSPVRAFALAPVVATLNASALALDHACGGGERSPANYCFTAHKPRTA